MSFFILQTLREYQRKDVLKSFQLNENTYGFRTVTQKFESPFTTSTLRSLSADKKLIRQLTFEFVGQRITHHPIQYKIIAPTISKKKTDYNLSNAFSVTYSFGHYVKLFCKGKTLVRLHFRMSFTKHRRLKEKFSIKIPPFTALCVNIMPHLTSDVPFDRKKTGLKFFSSNK